jgi:hypothetical protein
VILFHHRALKKCRRQNSGPEATTSSFCIHPSSLANWLPGIDSHDHSRRQRALSYWLDDPANGLESRPGLAPGKGRVASVRLDNFGMRLLIGASGGSCTRIAGLQDRSWGCSRHAGVIGTPDRTCTGILEFRKLRLCRI